MKHIAFLVFLATLAVPQTRGQTSAPPRPVAADKTASPTEIQGQVVTPDGRPVPRACVALTAVVPVGRFPAPVLVTSDDKGTFSFEAKAAKEWTVRAFSPPFAGSTEVRTRAGRSVTLKLNPGVVVSGSVMDGDTGQPLAGAEVEASEWETSPYANLDAGLGVARTLTDVKGQFTLSGVAASSRATVRARARGYATTQASVSSSSPLRLRLIPGHDLIGTVVDAAGKVVGRAALSLRPVSFAGTTAISTLSQPNGRFEARGLRNAPYELIVTAEGFAPFVRQTVLPDATSMTVTLEKAAAVTGRLIDEEGRGTRGTVRWVSQDGSNVPASLSRTASVDAATDGRFSLSPLKTGTHVLRFSAVGYPTMDRTIEVARAGELVNLGEVAFEPGSRLRGQVVDKDDIPVAGAKVQAVLTRRTETPSPASAESDTDGRFALRGLQERAYQVTVTASGFVALETALTPSADEHRLVLKRSNKVTGRIVDSSGAPVSRAQATLQRGDDRRSARGAASGDDGVFTIDAPEPGEAKLTVTAAGFESLSRGVQVAPDANLGDFPLSRGLRVRGTVIDSKGQPIAGATIENQTVRTFFGATSVETDDAGAFEIRGLSPGRPRLVATHRSFAPAQIFVDLTTEVGDAEPVKITMTRGARVEGLVRRRDGAPVPQALVQASSFTSSAPTTSSGPRGTLTAADGSFSFDNLYPDRAFISLMSGQNGQYSSVAIADVVLIEGETTPVTLTLRSTVLSGTVKRGGVPAPGLRVSVSGSSMSMSGNSDSLVSLASDIPWNTAVVGADGRYALRVVGPLNGMISLRDGEMADTLYSRPLSVPDVDAFAADVEFGGVRVTGRVIDEATGSGLAEVRISAVIAPQKDQTQFRNSQNVRSDASGRFALDLEPGAYQLVATAEGFKSLRQTLDASSSDMDLGEVPLERGGTLRGRLILPSGRPAAGAAVRAMAGAFFQTALAGSDREFSLSGLEGRGSTVIATDGADHLVVHRVETFPADVVEIMMVPAAKATVTITGDPAGLAETSVAMLSINGEYVGGFSGRSNAQGIATLSLPPGSLVLRAESKTHIGLVSVQAVSGSPLAAIIEMKPKPAPVPPKM